MNFNYDGLNQKTNIESNNNGDLNNQRQLNSKVWYDKNDGRNPLFDYFNDTMTP